MPVTPGLQLPYGIQPVNAVPVDSYSGPFTGSVDTISSAISAANSGITGSLRFKSMEVRLLVGGKSRKYWYKDGTSDADLVEFIGGNGGYSGGDVYFYVSGSITGSGGLGAYGVSQYRSLFGGDVVISGSIVQGAAKATEQQAVAFGSSIANGTRSAAFNSGIANGYYSFAINGGQADGNYSHAEGLNTLATGDYSHAEGRTTTAEGFYSHAEGRSTKTVGYYSHAEGFGSIALGSYSHAGGIYTIASGSDQTVYGQYNLRGNTSSLFVIGNGTNDPDANRSDVLRVEPKGLQVTGSVYITNGISGSHTTLADGRSFLVAGSNVSIVSASDGQITISSTGGGSGVSYFSEVSIGKINTTGSVAFAGGLGALYAATSAGTDVFTFVSGSKGTIASRAPSGISLFGGDIVTSGSITLDNGTGYGILHMTGGGELSLRNRSLGGGFVGSVFTSLGSAVNFMEVRPNGYATGSAFSIMPGLYAGPANPFNSHDTTFFVSGKRNAKGGNERGASVFGGDIVASGSAYFGTDTSDSIVVNSRLASDIIPDGNRTRNLGSDTARFANIYTGDLHLRNERGDYTLIEEEDCLTVRFNKTGKRYRFVLERAPEFDEFSD